MLLINLKFLLYIFAALAGSLDINATFSFILLIKILLSVIGPVAAITVFSTFLACKFNSAFLLAASSLAILSLSC